MGFDDFRNELQEEFDSESKKKDKKKKPKKKKKDGDFKTEHDDFYGSSHATRIDFEGK